jgi:hypothetical protein
MVCVTGVQPSPDGGLLSDEEELEAPTAGCPSDLVQVSRRLPGALTLVKAGQGLLLRLPQGRDDQRPGSLTEQSSAHLIKIPLQALFEKEWIGGDTAIERLEWGNGGQHQWSLLTAQEGVHRMIDLPDIP